MPPPPPAERLVLVVDDSPTMRQLVRHGLRRLPGATFDDAPDGVAACKLLAGRTYALVVLDINMPLLDGLKVVAYIRQSESNRQTPIVMVTTEGGAVEKQRALELGANAYLTKPIRASELLATARRLLGLA